MRKVIAIALLVVISSDLMANTMVFANYFYQYAKYVEACENKNNTQLQCNGQCQLAKQLIVNDTDNDNEQKEPRVDISQLLMFTQEASHVVQVPYTFNRQYIPTPRTLHGVSEMVFHPPQ